MHCLQRNVCVQRCARARMQMHACWYRWVAQKQAAYAPLQMSKQSYGRRVSEERTVIVVDNLSASKFAPHTRQVFLRDDTERVRLPRKSVPTL